jgi:hypothetical protein
LATSASRVSEPLTMLPTHPRRPFASCKETKTPLGGDAPVGVGMSPFVR